MENLSEYRSIICLDGDISCDFIRGLRKLKLPIFAADGAANTLIKNGIEPDVIIGDLDSVNNELLQNRKHIKIESQDNTDFEKSLDFVEQNSMAPAIVFGISGGYIDHILGNISIFSRTKCVAVCDDMIAMIIRDKKSFNLPVNTKISIFGIPSCIIKSEGLKWELNNEELSISEQNSCSNRTSSNTLKLKILDGQALVFIYTKTILDAGAINF
jgi:thiamine pyrophosphokinase